MRQVEQVLQKNVPEMQTMITDIGVPSSRSGSLFGRNSGSHSANIRVALHWLLGDGNDPLKGLRLAGALGQYWQIRSYGIEAQDWFVRGCCSRSARRASYPPHAGITTGIGANTSGLG